MLVFMSALCLAVMVWWLGIGQARRSYVGLDRFVLSYGW